MSVESPDLPAELPGLDVAAGLRRASGNEGLYRRLLAGLLVELEGAEGRLRARLDAGDAAGALQMAHAMRGNSATLGAFRVAASASALEQALRTRAVAEADADAHAHAHAYAYALLAATAAAIDEVIPQLARLSRSHRPEAVSEPAPLDATQAQVARVVASRLRVLLAGGDLAAMRCFDELHAALGAQLAHPLAQVQSAVERFDFEAAGRPLAEIMAALDQIESP